jgi:hypothetical protein
VKRALLLIATLALSACATETPTALHVAVERDARREGFRRVAVLTDDYYYCYPLTHEVIRVPKGFETDFASVPMWAAGVLDTLGAATEAGVVHDYLYAVGEPGQREKADTIFLDTLAAQHVDPIRRKLMYEAVRAAGAHNYGAASEWRFVDPETQKPVKPPPKPKTAVVAHLNRCEDLKGATLLKMKAMAALPKL